MNSGTNVSFQQVVFPSENHGIVISSSNIRYTFNGGDTWQWANLSSSGPLMKMQFLTDSIGWVCNGDFGGGFIYKTTDGGITWKQISRLPQAAYSFYFFDEQLGWAAINDASSGTHFIYNTRDGGKTWKQQTGGSDYIRDIFFSSARTGWVAGDNGSIYITSDSGNTWHLSKTNVVFHFHSIFATSDTVAYAVGAYQYGGCYKTTDGGKTWKALYVPSLAHLKSVQFISVDTGYIAGDRGTVLSTWDGGHTWFTEYTETQEDLTSVYFIRNKGIAVGRNGMMLRW